ncbi:TetR family transcriptional regulator [Ralstonia nicotianae]|uniref:Transcriptional regulator, TetR family n=3 Tax=Ralstonia solanacearum species complex TaxID=3116862 RepID=A0A0S4V5B0_RALSL|nr:MULTISPECIES: TetR family transcriptional regulator [Ralstonia]AOE91596.1 HTH-type transcriptional repressor BepR [Ralstonia solanacearum]APF89448.1 transcriptional regulator [Ralstonia solanacearum FJAT-1458]ARS59198.1 transcriptional regulator [Ralstonia solanacearum FJAT-91]ESS49562.1 transcription regulator protein [Ralstonia solanacearum SD54]AGH86914.1 Transcriptional regulator, TetR family [Ralstonia pseudosolanacearum FQY_4]
MARQTRAGAALTRARVIEAAIEVVSERGIRAATLADVAARAGVTRGAVYGHFPGKPALVAAIIDGLLWPLDIGDDLAGYRAHPRPLRRLHAQLSAQLTRCLQTPVQRHVVTLVLRESGYLACPAAAADHAMRLRDKAVASLGGVMGMARDRHQLRPDIEPDAAARCLHALGIGILSEHASRLARGVQIEIRQCLQLFFEGIERTAAGSSNLLACRSPAA